MYRLRQGVWGCLHILVRKCISPDRIVHEWTDHAGWSQRQGQFTCQYPHHSSHADEDERLLALYHSASGMFLNSSLLRVWPQRAYRPTFSQKLPEANTPAFRLAIPLTRSKKDSAGHWSRRIDVIHGALAASSSGASQQRTGPGPFGHRRPLSSARHQSATSAYWPSRVSAGARGHTFDSPRSADLTVGKSGSSRVPHVRACSSLFTGLHGSISQPDSGSVHAGRTCFPDEAGEWIDLKRGSQRSAQHPWYALRPDVTPQRLQRADRSRSVRGSGQKLQQYHCPPELRSSRPVSSCTWCKLGMCQWRIN